MSKTKTPAKETGSPASPLSTGSPTKECADVASPARLGRFKSALPYSLALLPSAILLMVSVGRYYGMSKEMLLFRHMAREIVQGTPLVYLGVHYDAITTPYTFALAAAFAAFGCSDIVVQSLSALLLLIGAFAAGKAAERLGSREYGWAVAMLTSLSASLVFHVYTFSEHTFTAFIYLAFLLTFLCAFRRRSPSLYALAGVLFAISVMHYPRAMSYYIVVIPFLLTELWRRRVWLAIACSAGLVMAGGMGLFVLVQAAAFFFRYPPSIPGGRFAVWLVVAAGLGLAMLAGLALKPRLRLDDEDTRRILCVVCFAAAILAVMGPVDIFVTMDYNGAFGTPQRFAYTQYGIPSGTHGRLVPVTTLFPGFDLTITPLLGSMDLARTAPHYTKLGGPANYKDLFTFLWNSLGPLGLILFVAGAVQTGLLLFRRLRNRVTDEPRLTFACLAVLLMVVTPVLCKTPDHRATVLMATLIPFVAAYPLGSILRRAEGKSGIAGMALPAVVLAIVASHAALWISHITWKPYRDSHIKSAKYLAPAGGILLDNHYPEVIEKIVEDCSGVRSKTNHSGALAFCGYGLRGFNFTSTWYAQDRLDARPQLLPAHCALWMWTPDRVSAYARMLSKSNPALRSLYIADMSPADTRNSHDIAPVITKFPAFAGIAPSIQYPGPEVQDCEHVWVYRVPVGRLPAAGDYAPRRTGDGSGEFNLYLNPGFEAPSDAAAMGLNWSVSGESGENRMSLGTRGTGRCLNISSQGRTILTQAIPGSHRVWPSPVVAFDILPEGPVDIIVEAESRAGSETLKDHLVLSIGPDKSVRPADGRASVQAQAEEDGWQRVVVSNLFGGKTPTVRPLPSYEWDFPELHVIISRVHVIPRQGLRRLSLDNMAFLVH